MPQPLHSFNKHFFTLVLINSTQNCSAVWYIQQHPSTSLNTISDESIKDTKQANSGSDNCITNNMQFNII